MTTTHLVGGPAAAGSLRVALDDAGRADDSVLWFPDELSGGPLRHDDPAVRVEWWQWWADMVTAQAGETPGLPRDLPAELAAFWEAVEDADQLAVWTGRDSSSEYSFFHAVCDRLSGRPFDVVELPGAIGARDPHELGQHLATARPITAAELHTAQHTWQRLQREDETFRIVRDGQLVSAPADHYDRALLDAVGSDWIIISRAVGQVMAEMNVGDSPLIWRVKALVESGELLADGDPWLARQTKVKRA